MCFVFDLSVVWVELARGVDKRNIVLYFRYVVGAWSVIIILTMVSRWSVGGLKTLLMLQIGIVVMLSCPSGVSILSWGCSSVYWFSFILDLNNIVFQDVLPVADSWRCVAVVQLYVFTYVCLIYGFISALFEFIQEFIFLIISCLGYLQIVIFFYCLHLQSNLAQILFIICSSGAVL